MYIALIVLGIIVVGIITAFISNNLLIKYFEKANKIPVSKNILSIELLVFFINEFNLNVKIIEHSTGLNNSYNIKQKIIILSSDVIYKNTVGSLAISMHELGHAIQHHSKSKLFYLYYFFNILNKITSILLIPLIIFLIISLFLPFIYLHVALILVLIFYITNLIIRLIIIPLEKNASNIALKLLKEYEIFNKKELKIAKKLLNLAYLTYIGGFFHGYIKFFRKVLRNF